MRKIFKRIATSLMAMAVIFSTTTASFAADDFGDIREKLDAIVEEDQGTPLPVDFEEAAPTRFTNLTSQYTGTYVAGSTFNGSFTVPSYLSYTEIKIAWVFLAQSGANTSAIMKLTVKNSSNTTVGTVYLPETNGSGYGYSIATLPAGTYSYTIEPYSNVSGTYSYGYQFYSF